MNMGQGIEIIFRKIIVPALISDYSTGYYKE